MCRFGHFHCLLSHDYKLVGSGTFVFFDETEGGVPLLVIYIKIENTHSFYILSYETKKETKKIREITNGCLSMLGTVL
jgi:hypothetical protein